MKFILKLLLLTSSMTILAGGFFAPVAAVYVQTIGGDLLTVGWAYAAFAVASGLLTLALGNWEDHIHHKEILLIVARSLSVIAFLWFFFIKTPMQLFSVQILLGLAAAISAPAFDSMYSKNTDTKKSASEWGIWEACYAIFTGVSAVAGGYLATYFGFDAVFLMMLTFAVFSLATTVMLRKHYKEHFKTTLANNRR